MNIFFLKVTVATVLGATVFTIPAQSFVLRGASSTSTVVATASSTSPAFPSLITTPTAPNRLHWLLSHRQLQKDHPQRRSPIFAPLFSSASLQPPPSPWFTSDETSSADTSKEKLKTQILQLGAALDRGQSYNPTSGTYYSTSMEIARSKVESLIAYATKDEESKERHVPTSLSDIAGEWELIFTTVKHGIFRSSPFFLAVQEAFGYAKEKEAFGEDKATLFFKLHELQTCSWGVSKIGRVAQRIDAELGYLYSEFDTSIFSLTVIPILGWFKLLPTFGGCVVTASKATLLPNGVLQMEVDYTTSRPVPGLNGLGEWIWSIKVPVGKIWKFLPWNQGRSAECSVTVRYYDEDFRVVEDKSGDFFVYSRPVVSRDLDI